MHTRTRGCAAVAVFVLAAVFCFARPVAAQVDWGEMFDEPAAAPKPKKKAEPAEEAPAAAPAPKPAPKKAAAPAPAPEEEAPAAAPAPKPAPKKVAAPAPEPEEEAPAAAPAPKPAPKKAAAPAPEPEEEAPAAAPPKPAPKKAAAPAPEPEEEAPAAAPQKAAAPAPEPEEEAPAASQVTVGVAALPPLSKFGLTEGDQINAGNMNQYIKLLVPGVEWGVRYGVKLTVAEAKHIELPKKFREATEKYSGQVQLAPDGLSLKNHVAGLPFPKIDFNDPNVALKIMWNFAFNPHPSDDQSQRGIDTYSGTISQNKPINPERHILTDTYKKMFYTGRIYVDPKPSMPNPDGVRYKESLHPLLEPFDLKGVGFTSYRYVDPSKQDDSWLYLPQLRRVRRMSTAQRSDALFGQDTDADAFGGFNGHIAWMDYKFLGEQVMLASMHGKNFPCKWQKPEDWMFDEPWEPRVVYAVEARSKLPTYAYSKRVLYIDKEAWGIPVADSYDRAGQLWKSQFLGWQQRPNNPPTPGEEPTMKQTCVLIVDTQLQHATSTGIPRTSCPPPCGMNNNVGEKQGVNEEFFSVAHLISGGR